MDVLNVSVQNLTQVDFPFSFRRLWLEKLINKPHDHTHIYTPGSHAHTYTSFQHKDLYRQNFPSCSPLSPSPLPRLSLSLPACHCAEEQLIGPTAHHSSRLCKRARPPCVTATPTDGAKRLAPSPHASAQAVTWAWGKSSPPPALDFINKHYVMLVKCSG